MRDNRGLITPAAGTFFSFQQGLSNLDLASVEVVRGAAGVLYGPGVTSGVVHFRSKVLSTIQEILHLFGVEK